MYQIEYNNPVSVHFIGIGGISMSGLAAVLLQEGFTVSGSDAKETPLTQWLAGLGAHVVYGQSADNIKEGIDVVVYTAAIHPDNPEFAAAVEKNIPMLSRAQLLGQLMNNYPDSVAVAGTHGKTTTTSMLTQVMLEAAMDPTISVGGILQSIGGNIRVGQSGTFLTEACEYTNSFLELFPKIGIILNIDADHLDFFKDLDDIRHSFRKFAENILPGGTLILPADLEDLQGFIRGLSCRILTFGVNEGDYHADQITYDENGCACFDLIRFGQKAAGIHLSVPGEHNIGNACAAFAAADLLGISTEESVRGLYGFTGTDRRFQKKGMLGTITVIDDYAHHPTEIRATLTAASRYPCNNVWCVFQPHTYSRTKALMDEFAEALAMADRVVLADIYAARETDRLGVSSAMLRDKIQALGTKAWYFESFDEIEAFLLEHCEESDMILTMGAGDIVKVGEHLLGKN